MQIGFIGLGKMGSRMVIKLLSEGHEVVVWNRSSKKIEDIKNQISTMPAGRQEFKNSIQKFKIPIQIRLNRIQNLKFASSIEDLVNQLENPRIVWIMVTAGEPTESILENLKSLLTKGDIVIDGGNAHFSDTQKRYETFQNMGIRFLGIGVSGGIIAFENGYPLTVGGDESAYQYIVSILDSLAKPSGGHEYFGIGGAGHFVKMVHNGIEYGIMQSLGEGFGVLEKSNYNFDLLKIAKLYQKGSLVSGFMLNMVIDALSPDPKLSNIKGIIAESGEARWTIEEAEKENLPVSIIKESLRFRTLSQVDERVQVSFAARLVAALRNAFGGHEMKKNDT